METLAYVNHDRWVADCPHPACNSAEELHDTAAPGDCQKCKHGTFGDPHNGRSDQFHCTHCHTIASVTWPDNQAEIWDALQERAVPSTRNWFPEGHPLARKANLPAGQTPAELRDETAQNEVR